MTRMAMSVLTLFLMTLPAVRQQGEYSLPTFGTPYRQNGTVEALQGLPIEAMGLSEGIASSLPIDPHIVAVIGGAREDKRYQTVLKLIDPSTGSVRPIFSDPRIPHDITRLATFRLHEEPRVQCLLFQYWRNFAGGMFDESKTYLKTFVLRDGALIDDGGPLVIGETDVVRHKNAEWGYVYTSGDDSGDPQPARVTCARILLRDFNNDDYTDIVLWQKYWEARPIHEDEGKPESAGKSFGPDFLLVNETLSVMLFDPSSMMFSEPVEDASLPKPDAKLWQRPPGNFGLGGYDSLQQ